MCGRRCSASFYDTDLASGRPVPAFVLTTKIPADIVLPNLCCWIPMPHTADDGALLYQQNCASRHASNGKVAEEGLVLKVPPINGTAITG